MVRRRSTVRFRNGALVKRIIRTPRTGSGAIPGAKWIPLEPRSECRRADPCPHDSVHGGSGRRLLERTGLSAGRLVRAVFSVVVVADRGEPVLSIVKLGGNHVLHIR